MQPKQTYSHSLLHSWATDIQTHSNVKLLLDIPIDLEEQTITNGSIKVPFRPSVDTTENKSHCTTAVRFNNSPNKASVVDTVCLFIEQTYDMPLSSISHKPVYWTLSSTFISLSSIIVYLTQFFILIKNTFLFL